MIKNQGILRMSDYSRRKVLGICQKVALFPTVRLGRAAGRDGTGWVIYPFVATLSLYKNAAVLSSKEPR